MQAPAGFPTGAFSIYQASNAWSSSVQPSIACRARIHPHHFIFRGSAMCERDSSDDILRGNELSRRHFSTLGLGATLAAMLPSVAAAAEVTESEVEIKTPDGTCD